MSIATWNIGRTLRAESVVMFLCIVMFATISRSSPMAIPMIAVGFRFDAKATFAIL
jgi:hypothetical protein